MPVGDFLGGLLNGFGQTLLMKQQMKKDEDERRVRAKLYEIELEKAQAQQAQQQQLAQLRQRYLGGGEDGTVAGVPVIPMQGAVATRSELQQPGVLDQLTNGRMQQYMREAAMLTGDVDSLMKMEERQQEAAWRDAILNQMNGGQMGGMRPSGLTIGSGGEPSFSFQAPEYRMVETPQGQIPIDPRNPPEVLPNKPQWSVRKRVIPGVGEVEEIVDLANPGLPPDPSQIDFGGQTVVKPEGYEDPIEKAKREQDQKLPPGDAGRVAAMDAGIRNLEAMKSIMVKDGKVDFELVGGMWANLPKSKGRKYRAQIEEAIDTAVKMKTGATANEQEMANYLRIYMPSPLDDDATAIDKLTRLESFLQEARGMSKGVEASSEDPLGIR